MPTQPQKAHTPRSKNFAASIPALLLLSPGLDNPDYILGAGSDTRVLWGCFLDVVTALAGIGSAVALFPVVKRQHEALALGFVTSRMFEAAVIVIGVVSLHAVVTLHQDVAGATATDPASLVTTGRSLVAVRNWTFLLGPNLMAAINALLPGTLMYKSGLVPRIIPTMGLVGAPLLLAAVIATLFGGDGQLSAWRRWQPSRSPPGSSRSAPGWSSKASGRRPSPAPSRPTQGTRPPSPETP
ncbi:MAG: DUF4386 domain-containing protein [Marmoricola sp.]